MDFLVKTNGGRRPDPPNLSIQNRNGIASIALLRMIGHGKERPYLRFGVEDGKLYVCATDLERDHHVTTNSFGGAALRRMMSERDMRRDLRYTPTGNTVDVELENGRQYTFYELKPDPDYEESA